MWGAGWGYWGWGWWFWAFWGIIAFLLIWFVAAAAGRGGRTVTGEEQVLRERYARGQMTKEEFDRGIAELERRRAA